MSTGTVTAGMITVRAGVRAGSVSAELARGFFGTRSARFLPAILTVASSDFAILGTSRTTARKSSSSA